LLHYFNTICPRPKTGHLASREGLGRDAGQWGQDTGRPTGNTARLGTLVVDACWAQWERDKTHSHCSISAVVHTWPRFHSDQQLFCAWANHGERIAAVWRAPGLSRTFLIGSRESDVNAVTSALICIHWCVLDETVVVWHQPSDVYYSWLRYQLHQTRPPPVHLTRGAEWVSECVGFNVPLDA